MWLNRVFNEQRCLKIDCSGVNKNGLGRYRTQPDDPEKQVCYLNKPCDDGLCGVFISNRIKTGNFSNGIYFKIDRAQSEDKTFDAEKTLKQDGAHDRFPKFDTDSKQPEFNGRGRKRGNEKILEQSTRRSRINKNLATPRFLSG